MDKISDKELVKVILDKVVCCGLRYVEDCQCDECKKTTVTKNELLSRLERGRKAIEAMGKAINCRETFLKSEMSVLGDLDMAADNFASSIHKIIEGYQQSCSEQGL